MIVGPRRLTRAEARRLGAAARALDGARAALAGALGEALGDEVAIGPPGPAAASSLDGTCARLARGDARAAVWVDSALALRLVARLLGRDEVDAPRPLTAAERGMAAWVALVALRAVAPAWRLVDVESGAPPDEATVEAEVCALGGTFTARLYLPEEAGAAQARGDARLVEAAAVDVSIVAGATRLAANDIAALEPGDVVIFDDVIDVRRGGPVTLRAGALRARADLDGARLCLASDWARHGGESMSDTRASTAEGLEVELVAEVGRLRMSGRDLMGLCEGAVVDLGRRVGDPIDLTSGGRVLARAELVDVEGDLGLRVIEILPP